MSKTHVITKIFRPTELTDTFNTWRKRFIIIITLLCNDTNVALIFFFFSSCQASIQAFSKHYSKWKTVSIIFRKTFQKRRLPILKIPQDNAQNIFFNFLASWTYFHNLTIIHEHSWNIFETEIRGMFFEHSGKINLWLLEIAKRSTFIIVKSYIFNTKITKMYLLKCSLNVRWMFGTLHRWGNTQQMFPEYWVLAG